MVTEQIGHYVIESVIGSGGMATVYKAFDQRIKRYVAVKMLGEHFTNQDYLYDRFEQEAQLIAKLEHHAIVPVYDYGEYDNRPYIIMRLMNGGSLAERLEDGPLDPAQGAAILNRICSALDKAHAHGVIHRDIKPGNILFDEDGIAFLADFGIARFSELTQSGMVVGSPHYMSPEQARGNPIDNRSDVYQLGVLLFEMLTATLPFDGESIDSVIYQHVHEPIPQLKSLNPSLPKKYQQVVEDAVMKDRDKRIPTALDLAARFQELVDTESYSREMITPQKKFDHERDTLFDYPVKKERSGGTRLVLLLTIVVALFIGFFTIPAFRENPM
ncbi:MAG: serine/threonine-protein kinase, partial [Chloroflexota bacterium]